MAEHFTGLILILEQIDEYNLKPEAANGLIKGVVMIISIMGQDQLCGAVEKVCLIQVSAVQYSAVQCSAVQCSKSTTVHYTVLSVQF